MLEKNADIIIIGGGIMGISTAYFLAKNNRLEILLLEQDLLAQASTGLSVGGIRQQFSHPANILLSQETLRFLLSFPAEFGIAPDLHQTGYLFLATQPATWKDFAASFAIQQRFNVPVEMLSPSEIKARWPFLRADDLQGGTFCSEDGYTDPYFIAKTMADAARKSGVKIHERTKVHAIHSTNGRISGVSTSQGDISAPIVVNAAGPWGGEVAAMAGLKIPVKPYRRQVFISREFSALRDPVPLIIDQDALFYFRKEGPGILMGKSDPHEPSSFNTHTDRSFLEQVILAALHRAPLLEQAEILRGWGGLYAVTPDENPVIEKAAEPEGYFCAIGFSGHGFQHGPAVGRILSDMIVEKDPRFDLSPFSGRRFARKAQRAEKRVV